MKILIAANSNENFESVITYLEEHSWMPKSEFRLLHVVEPSDHTDLWLSLSGATRSRQILGERQQEVQSQSPVTEEKCMRAIGDAEAHVNSSILVGHIEEVLVHEAKDWQADLVIVGLPAASFIGRYLESSMLSRVVSDTPCPVLFARKQRQDKARKSA